MALVAIKSEAVLDDADLGYKRGKEYFDAISGEGASDLPLVDAMSEAAIGNGDGKSIGVSKKRGTLNRSTDLW